MFAVCGLVVTTDGGLQTDRQRLVLVANHVTSLDPFILNLVMQYILVSQRNICSVAWPRLILSVSLALHYGESG